MFLKNSFELRLFTKHSYHLIDPSPWPLFIDSIKLVENSLFNVSLHELALIPEIFLAFSAITIITHCSLIAYNKKYDSRLIQFSVTWLSILILFLTFLLYFNEELITISHLSFEFSFLTDSLGFVSKVITIATSLFCMYLLQDYILQRELLSERDREEYKLLLLSVLLTLSFLIITDDFWAIFISIQLLSLSMYLIAGFKKDSLYSIRSGLKFLIIGTLSTSYFLLGWEYALFGLFLRIAVESSYLICKFFKKNNSNSEQVLINVSNLFFGIGMGSCSPPHIPEDSCMSYFEFVYVCSDALICLDVLQQLVFEANTFNDYHLKDSKALFSASKEGIKQLFLDCGYHTNIDSLNPLSRYWYWRVKGYWNTPIVYKGTLLLPHELIVINRRHLVSYGEFLIERGDPQNIKRIQAIKAIVRMLDVFLSGSKEHRLEFFSRRTHKNSVGMEHCYKPIRDYVKEHNREVFEDRALFLGLLFLTIPVGVAIACVLHWATGSGK
jgi:hypothetical protein